MATRVVPRQAHSDPQRIVLATLDNHARFETAVFDHWASRRGLTGIEDALVGRFLDRDRRTLEAGTGGGRILLSLRDRGFGDLHGFDYVPGFIDVARRRDPAGAIDFSVQDAADLDYPDDRFDQAIYLQQLLCFIADPRDRWRAVREAGRVLKSGGMALFSFLCHEARMNHRLTSTFARYLRFQRLFRHRDVSPQYQPWLKTVGRPNLGALVDRPPYVYWYRFREALDVLDRAGLRVTWAASTAQMLGRGSLGGDPRELDPSALDGMLYVACRRV
jgi:SAM-dependent methyltransferase